MRFLFHIILFLAPVAICAQSALGTWQDYLPYSKTIGVAKSGSKVYCATPFALFSYDETDNSVERLSTVNALSDIQVSAIATHPATGSIMVGYTNGNLDIITAEGTTNIPFIKTSGNILGDKTIYRFSSRNELAYLACGFGVVVLDVVRKEIKETFTVNNPLSNKVNSVAYLADTLYAATDNGIFKAFADHPFLTNPSIWSKLTSVPDSIENSNYSLLYVFNGYLYANHDHPAYNRDVFLRKLGNNWEQVPGSANRDVLFVSSRSDTLLLTHNGFLASYDTAGVQRDLFWTYLSGQPQPSQAILDKGDIKWVADKEQGLVRWQSGFYTEVIKPDGPFTTGCFAMDAVKGSLWTVPGTGWFNGFVLPSVSALIDGNWQNLSYANNAILDTTGFYDFVCVAANPDDPLEAFVGSISNEGMIRIYDGEIVNIIDTSNSTLDDRNDLPGSIYISGLSFDKDGNLWVANGFTQKPLSVRKPDGTWQSFYLGSDVAGVRVTDVMIDHNNYIWLLVPGKGVLVFNHNGTIGNTTDDEFRLLTAQEGNGGLPNSNIESMAVDRDGEVWLGTHEGIAVLFSSSSLFSSQPINAQQILLEQDGNIQILLETEIVSAIEIDGGNRKWIGTETGGVYLMSEDGTEEILSFNTSNSPLFSNTIYDIEWEEESGVVFIATMNGLLGFKSTSTKPDAFYSSVYAYPNPVRPEYDGLVGIKGLAFDSFVKITDVAGNIVYETRSEGGLAIWNCNNFAGERVASGVYLVFATDAEGKEGEVSKILVISQ